MFWFFFFQAEDGIRDDLVTGVQTCALPIWEWLLARIAEKPDLTLRAVVAELAGRGTPASYGAGWRVFFHEGVPIKKKTPRPPTRTPPHPPPPGPLGAGSQPASPPPPAVLTRRVVPHPPRPP